tara:strand:- start:72 stop:1223 length:1152 start_codon:yes stop_codon:yes gene_type:complete
MFIMSSFLGGAAKRGSEIMEEERKNTQKIVDNTMRLWTELGVPAYKERKQKRKDLSMKFETLSNYGYSGDQIEVAARQGDLDDLISYTKKATAGDFGPDFKFNVAEVVRLTPDYKETGRTKAQILDSIMGKVERGMDLSDAIEEAGGQTKGFMGQDLSGIAKKRAEAYQTGMGVDVQTLAALSRGDVTMEDSPVSGTVRMYDPTAEARAKQALSGGQTGQPGISTASRMVEANILAGLEGSVFQGQGADGIPLYSHEKKEQVAKLKRIIREEMAKRNINRYSAADLDELEQAVAKRMGVSAQGEGQVGDEKADGVTPSDATTMEADAISRIQGLPEDAGSKKADIIEDVVRKIYEYYLEKEGEEKARQKAAEARDRIIGKIRG